LATSRSSTERAARSCASRAKAWRSSSSDGALRSSKSSRSRSSDSGLPAACSAASRIRSSGGWFITLCLDVDGRKGLALHQVDQLLLDQLQYRHEGHYHPQLALFRQEQAGKGDELAAAQALQHISHALAG